MSNPVNKLTFASAALAVAMSSTAMAAPAPAGSSGAAIGAGDKVHCYGINSCKGNSDCKTTVNSCKGLNACKGQGFKGLTAMKCLESDGVISDV